MINNKKTIENADVVAKLIDKQGKVINWCFIIIAILILGNIGQAMFKKPNTVAMNFNDGNYENTGSITDAK